jgi:ribonuclease BN (tRNA processing enzyme)
MRVTVLGCSGSVPGPGSPASGYLVQYDGYSLALDLGNGAFGALLGHLRANELDAVVLSHLHPDHCVDMAAFEVALLHGTDRRDTPVPVIAPPGARERLAAAARPYVAATTGSREMSSFAFADLRGAESVDRMIGPFRLRAALVAHPVPTFAIRLDLPGGPSLVYSGDTGPTQALVDLARDADMLLCESAFVTGPDLPADMHMTGRQAGEHAAKAQVGTLVVTHVPPWYSVDGAVAEARDTFDGPVIGATAGAVYQL